MRKDERVKILGIDIGLAGAFACLNEQGKVLFVEDMPVLEILKGKKKVRKVDVARVVNIIERIKEDGIVMVEMTSPAPRKFSTPQSNWCLGYGEGMIEGILLAKRIKYETVVPQVWQRYFKFLGQRPGQTKMMSYYRASQLFPEVELKTPRGKVLDGRADALLIAEYGRRRFCGI